MSGCKYVFTKGTNEGQTCGKTCMLNSNAMPTLYCGEHYVRTIVAGSKKKSISKKSKKTSNAPMMLCGVQKRAKSTLPYKMLVLEAIKQYHTDENPYVSRQKIRSYVSSHCHGVEVLSSRLSMVLSTLTTNGQIVQLRDSYRLL